MDKKDAKNLKRRYLIWFYKVTKEAWDKVERKFTQLDIDRDLLDEMKKLDTSGKAEGFIEEFEVYIQNKEKKGLDLKYDGNKLKPEYYFLDLKLKAIERVIENELGKKALGEIKSLYEQEMTERIMKSRETK